LLILIQETVFVHIKNLDEVGRTLDAEKIVNCLLVFIEDQVYISFIQNTLLSEVSFPYGVPDIFALSGSSQL
jgi:hypothetical protein